MILNDLLFIFYFQFQAEFIAFCVTFWICGNIDLDSADPIFDAHIEELILSMIGGRLDDFDCTDTIDWLLVLQIETLFPHEI